MIDLGPDKSVMSTKDILETHKSALKEKIKSVIDEDTEPEKIEQYRKARINDFYWRGIFEFAASRLSEDIVDFSPIGIPVSRLDSKNAARGNNVNIIRGDFMKAVAVIGSKSPDVSAVADEADDEESLEVARRADIVADTWQTKVNVDEIQMELMLDLCTTTTTFIWTGWRVDGDLYGYVEEDDFSESEDVPVGDPHYKCVNCGNETPVDYAMSNGACSNPECGAEHTPEDYHDAPTATMPKNGGTKRYPKGGVECEVCNIFEVSVPFFSKNLKKAEWLRREIETTPSAVLEIFPDLPKEVLDGGESQNSGSMYRAQMSSERGIQRERANKVRFSWYWLRPSFLNNYRETTADQPDGSENEQTLAQLLRDHFPRGVRITMVNGEPVDLVEESIDDVWTACKPTVSKTIFCDPLCQDTIPVQDLGNEFNDISIQTLKRALPVTLFETQLLDHTHLRNTRPLTAEMLPVKLQTGRSISEMIGQLPMAKFSDQQMPFYQGIRAQSRENNGITEAIFGGGPGMNTAHEAEIRKQQALMQLRITYNNTRQAKAEFTDRAVRQYAKYAPGQFKGKPRQGMFGPIAGEQIEIGDLVDGKFHFEADEGMPRTFEDKRANFRELVSGPTAAPQPLQAAVGLSSPVNAPEMQKYFGTLGWYYPGRDERKKLAKIIARLLRESPQQGPNGTVPSVSLDPYDDPQIMGSLMQAWLNSDAGQSESQSNQQGFQNAVAYWQACQTASAPPAPPVAKKASVNIDPSKLPPDQALQVMNDVGIQVQPSQAPPAPGAPGAAPAGPAGPPSQKKPTLPKPPQGGQGEPVPEPAVAVPQQQTPIPGN